MKDKPPVNGKSEKLNERLTKNSPLKKCPDCEEGWHCKGDDPECGCWCIKKKKGIPPIDRIKLLVKNYENHPNSMPLNPSYWKDEKGTLAWRMGYVAGIKRAIKVLKHESKG